MTNQDRTNQSEWEREANWSAGLLGVYRSTRDSRMWVPKRSGLGYTLNFAHRGSWAWLIGLLGLALAVAGISAWASSHGAGSR